MVTLTSGSDRGVQMDGSRYFDIFYHGDVEVRQPALAIVNVGVSPEYTSSDHLRLIGGNFSYNNAGLLTGGTITNIESVNATGAIDFSISDVSLSAAQFAQTQDAREGSSLLNVVMAGNDNLYGNLFDDKLLGFGGHDNLFGERGKDTLDGGDGNDHLYGQSPNGGQDLGDLIYGGNGSDYIQGNAGNDTLEGGDGSDRINGGADADLIKGQGGNDIVNGNLGNDRIEGGSGNDSLRGGQGNDTIYAGVGNDIISGDLGRDEMNGDGGSNIFLFSGASSTIESGGDIIFNFSNALDRISLGYAVTTFMKAGFTSDAAAARVTAQQMFDNHAGNNEAVAVNVGGDTHVFYSSFNNGVVDSVIILEDNSGTADGLIFI